MFHVSQAQIDKMAFKYGREFQWHLYCYHLCFKVTPPRILSQIKIIRVCPRDNSRVTSLSPESYFLSFLICLPQWGVKGVAFHLWGVGMFSFSFSESNQGIGTEKLLWDLKGPLYKHTGGIHQQVLYCRQSTPCLVPSTRQFLVWGPFYLSSVFSRMWSPCIRQQCSFHT